MFFGEAKPTPREKVLLIVDFNNLLWRVHYSYSSLSFGGRATGCLYGIVSQLVKYISTFKPSHIIFTDDSPPYLRKELFPNLKAGRVKLGFKDLEEFKTSKLDCIAFLNLINVPVLAEKGLESDDLIASLVVEYSDKMDKVIILSNDSDLHQILYFDNVFIQKSKVLYGIKEFKEEYLDLDINDYIKHTALSGSHNGVPGLPGIGPVKAKKILTDGKWEEVYSQNKEILDLYLKLVKLPFNDDFKSPPLVKHSYNERQVLNFLRVFGINLTQNMIDSLQLLN
jgi:DNA polymerase-1